MILRGCKALEMVMNARAPLGLARVSHKATALLVARGPWTVRARGIPTAAASSECFFELVGRARTASSPGGSRPWFGADGYFPFFGCLVEFARGLSRRI